MKVVYARARFIPGGYGGVVEFGTHWPADDPIVAAHPDMFSADPGFGLAYSVPPAELLDPPVEMASAAPGERRAAVRRS